MKRFSCPVLYFSRRKSTSRLWPSARCTSTERVSAGLGSFAEFPPALCGKSALSAPSPLLLPESVVLAERYLSSAKRGGDHDAGRAQRYIRSASLSWAWVELNYGQKGTSEQVAE